MHKLKERDRVTGSWGYSFCDWSYRDPGVCGLHKLNYVRFPEPSPQEGSQAEVCQMFGGGVGQQGLEFGLVQADIVKFEDKGEKAHRLGIKGMHIQPFMWGAARA